MTTTNEQIADELDNIREALHRLTGVLRGSDRDHSAVDDGESWEVPGQGRWTRQDLEWLAARIDARPIAAAVADMAATAADKGHGAVTWPEVLRATGAPDDNRSRSHLGALTEWSKERFGGDRRWPFEARQETAADGKMTYRMPRGLAAAWRAIRGL